MGNHQFARRLSITMAVLGLSSVAAPVHASEGGASFYLLGSGGAEAGVAPPVKGIFFSNAVYYYGANPQVNRKFVLGGNIVAGLDMNLVADFGGVAWVPTQDFLGGTLTLGALLPVAAPMLNVSAVITGPRGRQVTISRRDSAMLVGDPVASASLGWKTGKLHIQASSLVNIPIGMYREDQLANISFHRWVLDMSLALSWNDPASGWDVSGKAGGTFNGNNRYTDYNTGTEFHLEGSVEKMLSKSFSLGVQGYYFKQLTADTGAGATLGAYKGEVASLGGTAAYRTVLGRSPTTFRLQLFREFDATNRLEGTAVTLSMALPLKLFLRPHPGE